MTVYNPNFDVTYCRHRHRRGELAGPPTIRRVALTVLRTHAWRYPRSQTLNMAWERSNNRRGNFARLFAPHLIAPQQQPYLHKIPGAGPASMYVTLQGVRLMTSITFQETQLSLLPAHPCVSSHYYRKSSVSCTQSLILSILQAKRSPLQWAV